MQRLAGEESVFLDEGAAERCDLRFGDGAVRGRVCGDGGAEEIGFGLWGGGLVGGDGMGDLENLLHGGDV